MYGILKSSSNDGGDTVLAAVFVAPLSIESKRVEYAQDTMNLRRVTNSTNAQRWELEVGIAPTNEDHSFFVNNVVAGISETIYVRPPQPFVMNKAQSLWNLSTPGGTSHAAGSSVISTAENPLGNSYQATPGELIQINGHKKVYMVKAVSSTSITIFPELVVTAPGGSIITRGNHVTMHCKYDKDTVFGIKYQDGILTEAGTYRLIEVI